MKRTFTKYPSGYVRASEYADNFDRSVFTSLVPKNIQNRTIRYMEQYNMGLSDAFNEACRDLAKPGTELYDAWYVNDFRKFIPSAYLPEYLDFEKYPIEY